MFLAEFVISPLPNLYPNPQFQEAYDKNMVKVQAKLKECIDRQSSSMTGLEKLSEQLANGEGPEPQNFDDTNKSNKNDNMIVEEDDKELGVADALETTTATVPAADLKGENKAPRRKTRRGKKYSYMLKAKGQQKSEEKKEKPRPKFFCQF